MRILVKRSGGRIKTCHLREPGAKRGNVLYWLPSLMAYLHGTAEEQRAAGAELTETECNALPVGGEEA
jgi:hypothetical protein